MPTTQASEGIAPGAAPAWFVACRSGGLGDRTVAATLHGVPLVLFRDAGGAARALEDRCPHRNAPLSAGKVRGGALECAYHGWRFDGAGACLAAPGLSAPPASPAAQAASYACLEQDGYVWVASRPGAAPPAPPPRFLHAGAPGYTTVRRELTVRATLLRAAENVLDVPHTAFLHGGLFRARGAAPELEVVVRRWADRCEAEYLGEPRPAGLAARLLAPRGGVVTHFDRFLLPCLAQVEYRLGEASHLVATTALTPLDGERTRLFAAVTFRLPLPGWLVAPALTPIATRILGQDARMLALQTETIRRFGGEERFASTELDVLGPQLRRLLAHPGQAAAPGTPPEHEHRARMRR